MAFHASDGTFTAQTQATNSFVQVCAYDPTKFAEYGVQDGECSKYTNEFGEQTGSERDGANSRCICRPDVGGVAQAANTIDLSCGDYDNDGKMDLVVANKGYMSNDNAAQNMYNYVQTKPSINELHKGNGDGTFTAIVTSVVVHASGLVKQGGNPNPFQFQINQATTSIDFVDLDSDGFLDIVVGSWNKDYDVDSADGNCMRVAHHPLRSNGASETSLVVEVALRSRWEAAATFSLTHASLTSAAHSARSHVP